MLLVGLFAWQGAAHQTAWGAGHHLKLKLLTHSKPKNFVAVSADDEAVVSSRDNRYMVYGAGNSIFDTWGDRTYFVDTRTGKTRQLPISGNLRSLSDDGRTLLYAPQDDGLIDSHLYLFDTATGAQAAIPEPPCDMTFCSVGNGRMTPDGQSVSYVFSRSPSGSELPQASLHFWSASTGLLTAPTPPRYGSELVLTPAGTVFYTAVCAVDTNAICVTRWDAATSTTAQTNVGSESVAKPAKHCRGGLIAGLDGSPGGNLVIWSTVDPTCSRPQVISDWRWDVGAGDPTVVRRYSGERGQVQGRQISDDGREARLTVVNHKGHGDFFETIDVTDSQGKKIQRLKQIDDNRIIVNISGDGRNLLFVSDYNFVASDHNRNSDIYALRLPG